MSGWIAVDWGTTTLRATRMDGARAGETRESGDGMNGLSPEAFEPRLLDLAGDWIDGPTEIVVCGMAGARQGWAEAPYRAVPCPPVAAPLTVARSADPRLSVRIVPGLSQRAPHPDVMRGEETQIAGILREVPEFDGVACLPGTHAKWAHVSAGEVVSFRTAMTGEIFGLLSRSSVLRHSLGGNDWQEAAFLEAVSDALARPEALSARLFEIRAADLLEGQDPAIGRSRLSGLLIGAELAATKPWWLGRDVIVTGAPALSQAYAAALRSVGLAPRILSAAEMTLAGLKTAKDLP